MKHTRFDKTRIFPLFTFLCLVHLWALLMIIKCEAGELYLDVGIGYYIDGTHHVGKDYEYYEEHKTPTAYAALGYKVDDTLRVELSHDSNWFVGTPFNNQSEAHLTKLRIVKRFELGRF